MQNIGFFEIYGVSARKTEEGGLSQCGHYSDKGRGSIFRDFVRTSFMDKVGLSDIVLVTSNILIQFEYIEKDTFAKC